MTNIVPSLQRNIASVQAEIKRVRGQAKKDRAQPLRLEENLAAADIPKPLTNSGC
jgi:hypothetical protein